MPESSITAANAIMPNAVLRFDNWGYRHASRRYFSVRGLNLTVEAGQRVLLLGASGIGKSTILEGAAGLLGSNGYERQDPGQEDGIMVDAEGGATEGHVFVDDVPVREAIGRVGLVLQDPDAQAVFQRLGDNVAFGPENLHVERGEIWRRVGSSLAAVGLQGLQLHRSVTHLSGGQMQRLALAGALAMRPSVLLLDEPTANLDPDGVTQVVTAVRDVLDEFRSTMVLVEHHAEPWIDLIDRVIVLGSQTDQDAANGQERHTVIMADGTPDEVFRDPNLDFARLGIWVPRRYMRGECRIGAIHTGTTAKPWQPASILHSNRGRSPRWSARTAPANRRWRSPWQVFLNQWTAK